MSAPPIHPVAASVEAGDQDLAREFQKIEKRDWWIWGYSISVAFLLVFAIVAFSFPAVRRGVEAIFKVDVIDVVFGLIALVVLFNAYVISQAILIKRLRRQLAEKQGHSDLLRNLAMVDPLTGLYNRRFAEQRLAAEVARSERKGHPLTVLTLDLNKFKEINDTYGHPAGDLVLQEFAAHLNRNNTKSASALSKCWRAPMNSYTPVSAPVRKCNLWQLASTNQRENPLKRRQKPRHSTFWSILVALTAERKTPLHWTPIAAPTRLLRAKSIVPTASGPGSPCFPDPSWPARSLNELAPGRAVAWRRPCRARPLFAALRLPSGQPLSPARTPSLSPGLHIL